MNDIKTIRARHLHRRFEELTAEYKRKGYTYSVRQVCEVIAHEPAPRYYLTESYAVNAMYAIRNGRTQTSRQLKDLYRQWRRTNNIIKAINTPAPSYYLSATRIYRILINTIRL